MVSVSVWPCVGVLQEQAEQEEDEKNTTSCDTSWVVSCYPEHASVAILLPVTDLHGLTPEVGHCPAPGLLLPAIVWIYAASSNK